MEIKMLKSVPMICFILLLVKMSLRNGVKSGGLASDYPYYLIGGG